MRVLYHHRIASRDGQITHIEEMVHALRSLGHEVLVVGPDVHKKDSGQGGSAGWVGRLKALLPGALYELAELAYAVVAYRRLVRAIKAFKPDLIYERYALYQPAGVWASRRSAIPMLLEVNAPYAVARRKYGGLSWPWLADQVERYTFKGASLVFPVTHVLAQMIAGWGVDSERIKVVPNAINPDDYENLPSVEQAKAAQGLQGRVVIGFIGFVREWDQLHRIVDWLALRPAGDNATLMIVGDGPVRGDLEAQARRLGIGHKLVFTGVVPRQRVPATAMAFDVALQTALVPYASPLCLFEYLALGKPVVAPDQPNHHEVLHHEVDCLMYEPDKAGSIERALDQLLADEPTRTRLGQQARQTLVQGNHHWLANAQRVMNAAKELRRSP